MKKLTKVSLEAMKEQMPVLNKIQESKIVGGWDCLFQCLAYLSIQECGNAIPAEYSTSDYQNQLASEYADQYASTYGVDASSAGGVSSANVEGFINDCFSFNTIGSSKILAAFMDGTNCPVLVNVRAEGAAPDTKGTHATIVISSSEEEYPDGSKYIEYTCYDPQLDAMGKDPFKKYDAKQVTDAYGFYSCDPKNN